LVASRENRCDVGKIGAVLAFVKMKLIIEVPGSEIELAVVNLKLGNRRIGVCCFLSPLAAIITP
jgi:hypothetical protein